VRPAPGGAPDAPGGPGGPLQEALAQDHGPRSRGRDGQGPHPAPLRPDDRARRPLCGRHHLHRHLGGLGVPGHRDRPGQPPRGGLGARRPHAHGARLRRARDGVPDTPATPRCHLPQRPRSAVREHRLHRARPGPRRGAVGRPGGRVLGQRGGRELLRHHQARADRHARLADARRASHRGLRLHRGLVQHPSPAQHPRLPQPGRVRGARPQRRPRGAPRWSTPRPAASAPSAPVSARPVTSSPTRPRSPGAPAMPRASRLHSNASSS